jgi:MYXO-CTERM domain-containing protein
MVPMRITMEGYVPALPLRMIAAGVADKVGLSLLVLANGRVEAGNFPNNEVRERDLVWDWNAPGSPARDFLNVFERLNREAGGRLWLTESSSNFTPESLNAQRWQIPQPETPPGMNDTTLEDDLATAFAGLNGRATITRLRADLLGRMLDRDLQLSASALGTRSRTYRYGDVRNTPAPPTCGNDAPGFSSGELRCSATPGTTAGSALSGLAVGLLGAALAVRRRRRATA